MTFKSEDNIARAMKFILSLAPVPLLYLPVVRAFVVSASLYGVSASSSDDSDSKLRACATEFGQNDTRRTLAVGQADKQEPTTARKFPFALFKQVIESDPSDISLAVRLAETDSAQPVIEVDEQRKTLLVPPA